MTRRIILFLVVALLGAGIIAASWLLTTEAGLQWAYAQLRERVPGTLEVKALAGRLAGPLELHGLDYQNDALEARVEHARLNWSPLALLVARLEIEELTVDGARIVLKEDETPREPGAPDFTFPLTLDAKNVRFTDIDIERHGQAPYRIHTLEIAGAVDQRVAHFDHLRVAAQTFEFEAEGAVGLQSDTEQRLRINWRVELPDSPAIAGAGDIAGHLADLTLNQRLAEPVAASMRARVRNALTEPAWEAKIDMPEFDVRRLGFDAPAARLGVSLEASGDTARFQTSGSLNARVPDLPPLTGRFRLHGSTAGEVVVEQLTVRAAGTDALVAVQGRWQPEAPAWQAQASWRNLRWPLTGEALVVSPEGALDASGDLKRYRIRLNATTRGDNLPQARWSAAGTGGLTHIALDTVTVETLGATLKAAGRAQWSPQLQWQAKLEGDSLDPAARWPQWPGSLALRATLSGDAAEIRVRVEELRGTLREHAFVASGRVVRRGDSYPTLALKVRSGDAAANVTGSIGDRWDLSWSVDTPELGALLPRAGGRLNGAGRVDGPRMTPRIAAKLTGAGLAYDTTQIENMTLDAAVDLSDRTRSHARLRAVGGTVRDRPFERIAFDAAGFLANHSLAVELRLAEVALQAQLTGSYADTAWRGTLRDSTLRVLGEDWKLDGRPEIRVGVDRVTLDETCWSHAAARTCVTLQHAGEAGTALAFTARQLPFALFDPFLPETIELEGTLDGEAQARLRAGRLLQADARFDLGPGAVALAAPAVAQLKYKSAALRLVADDGGLRARATAALPNGDSGRAELALPGFQAGADIMRQPAEGRLVLALRDLTPLAAFFPQAEELRGSLHVDLALAGTLDDPSLRGEATLTEASARIPAAGIRVANMRLTAAAAGGGELRLSGEAYSGDGQLSLAGRVTFPEDRAWRAELRIAGAQFLAADLPEARVYVSPDLRARLAPGEVDVTGEVRIPRATFALRQPERDTVPVSPDVVIVNAPGAPPPPQAPWKVTAQVQVTLGDTVTIAGFGLSARISGSVRLVDTPGQATTARGELRVAQGIYEAYGQKLEVERGRLLFVGGPVSNPGIDARAVRRIEQITVGVEVKGTLQSPQLTLFSDPPTGQADALSYLLFGRPLEAASATEGQALAAAARALRLAGGERLAQRIGASFGIEEVEIETGTTPESAALVLGKQLSPRLYINYSIGLFEPVNVLRLRYRLSPHWSLEAQSGPAAGGDLIFTIER